MRDGSELLTQAEYGTTLCIAWVKGGERHGYSKLGRKVGAAVGGDCAQAAV